MWPTAGAAVAAALTTCLELGFRNQRHPFGDDRSKALLWWLAIVLLDIGVGLLVLYGFLAAGLLHSAGLSLAHAAARPVLSGAVIGLVGPLALRSQIATKKIANKDSAVGVTFVYDVARVNALYALDERMVRLKRRDVRHRRERWIARGLDAEMVAAAFERHVSEHDRLPEDQRQALMDQVQAILSVRGAEDLRMDGMIKLLRKERFGGLMDELNAYVPPESAPMTDSGGELHAPVLPAT